MPVGSCGNLLDTVTSRLTYTKQHDYISCASPCSTRSAVATVSGDRMPWNSILLGVLDGMPVVTGRVLQPPPMTLQVAAVSLRSAVLAVQFPEWIDTPARHVVVGQTPPATLRQSCCEHAASDLDLQYDLHTVHQWHLKSHPVDPTSPARRRKTRIKPAHWA